jgi:hypothetical protein
VIDVEAMRAEIATLDGEVAALERQLEAARAEGDDEEMRRLKPQIYEAQDRWADTRGMVEVCEAFSLTEGQPQGWTDLNRCAEALDTLLYHYEGDGVGALQVVEASPTRVILVGRMWWVVPQERDVGELVEATFEFDEDSRALNRVMVRAGELGSSDETPLPVYLSDLSPREVARLIARRPENDEQWAIVVRAQADGQNGQ